MMTHTSIESKAPRILAAASLTPRGRVFPTSRKTRAAGAPRPVTTDDGVWPQEFQNFEVYTRIKQGGV